MLVTADDAVQRAGVLAARLETAGCLAAGWSAIFGRVRRDLFIPDRVWLLDGGTYRALRRSEAPERWWEAVYADTAIVTQVADGPDAATSRQPTSSASEPGMVGLMLAALGAAEGDRVLEIGTGTGWNAALLAARLGGKHVTTVEVDAVVARRARIALARSGYDEVRVVAGDGADGWAVGAPFDRIIATCAVHEVPPAWIAQTRPGGVIVTPWGNGYRNGVLLRLVVGEDGTASGRVVDDAAFMWLRAQQPALKDDVFPVVPTRPPVCSRTLLDPRAVVAPDAAVAIGLRVGDCRYTVGWGSGDEAEECTVWLADPDGQSWASADYEPEAADYAVEQAGPRRLWDEVEAAWQWWDGLGRPDRRRLRLTVTASGDQRAWYDVPGSPAR